MFVVKIEQNNIFSHAPHYASDDENYVDKERDP